MSIVAFVVNSRVEYYKMETIQQSIIFTVLPFTKKKKGSLTLPLEYRCLATEKKNHGHIKIINCIYKYDTVTFLC